MESKKGIKPKKVAKKYLFYKKVDKKNNFKIKKNKEKNSCFQEKWCIKKQEKKEVKKKLEIALNKRKRK